MRHEWWKDGLGLAYSAEEVTARCSACGERRVLKRLSPASSRSWPPAYERPDQNTECLGYIAPVPK